MANDGNVLSLVDMEREVFEDSFTVRVTKSEMIEVYFAFEYLRLEAASLQYRMFSVNQSEDALGS